MANGNEAIKSGFEKAKRLIYNHLFEQCVRLCDSLIRDALQKREFQSFTGNTATSYACGIYRDGVLKYMVASGEDMEAPVHAKVQNGQRLFLPNPYEGAPRGVKGRAEIVYNMSGMDTSFRILRESASKRKGLSIVMTTGTEYSEYLEGARLLNVLTDTSKKQNVRRLVHSTFRQLQ